MFLFLSVLYALSFSRLYKAEYEIDTIHESSLVFRDVYDEVNQLYKDVEDVRGFSYNSPETLRVLNDWFNNNRLIGLLERVDAEIDSADSIKNGEEILLLTRQEMTQRIKSLENSADLLERDKLTAEGAIEGLRNSHDELKQGYLVVVNENDELRENLNNVREKLFVRAKLDENAEHVLSDFIAQLRQLVGRDYEDKLVAGSTNLLQEAENLVGTLVDVQDGQKKLVEREIQRIDYSLATMGNIIDMTGLTVKRLTNIGLLPGASDGIGGPVKVADTENARLTDILDIRQQQLDYRLNKLEAMQALMECIPLIVPVDAHRLGSKFGFRTNPFTGKGSEMHYGTDFSGWHNTPVWATAAGIVTHAGTLGAYGNAVVIDHGCGFKTRYGHFRSVEVKKGDKVKLKQVIGRMGSTGRSTGPHVHYEVRFQGRPLDAQKFIQAGKYVYKGQSEENG